MTTEQRQSDVTSCGALIRIGGGALLVALLIHIVANAFLKEFPPADPTLAELQAYLEAEAGTWRIVHGMRYLAVVCLTVFLAAMFLRIQRANAQSSGGWEYVGFAGGILHVTNLFITNGIETFAFLDFGLLSERPELFWLMFHSTRVLFNVEIAVLSSLAWFLCIGIFLAGGVPPEKGGAKTQGVPAR